MKGLIDTIFNPALMWLNGIYTSIMQASVPVSRPLNVSQYFGVFSYLGSYWIAFVVSGCFLAFVYVVCYIAVSQRGLLIHFKDMVKWW